MSQMWLYWQTIWLNNSLQAWKGYPVKQFKDACPTAYSNKFTQRYTVPKIWTFGVSQVDQ